MGWVGQAEGVVGIVGTRWGNVTTTTKTNTHTKCQRNTKKEKSSSRSPIHNTIQYSKQKHAQKEEKIGRGSHSMQSYTQNTR